MAAQHELREVFDNLVISLSKFTTLLHPPDPSSSVAITLASEHRARLSLQVLLSLCRQHASLLREGWKNLLDCLLSLFRARLLPEEMVEVHVLCAGIAVTHICLSVCLSVYLSVCLFDSSR